MKFILIVVAVLLNSEYSFAQEGYQITARDVHNTYRAKHGSPPLTLDSALIEAALKCATHYANKESIDVHDCPYTKGVGENLVGGPGVWTPIDFAKIGTKMWYDEIGAYNYSAPGFSMGSGHFTQVVWKASTKFGFAVITNNRFTAGVGLYNPPGNVKGQFPQNVLPLP